MTNLLVVVGVMGLLCVSLAILVAVSGDKRRHRLGATLLPVWCVSMLVIYGLRLLDAGLALPYGFVRGNIALGLVLTAWAMLDVSRLARTYGTTQLAAAAEIAKGLLLTPDARAAAWASFCRHLPIPAGVKGTKGTMLAINRAYEMEYGRPITAYAGSVDKDLWDADIAERFGTNDAKVARDRRAYEFFEPAPKPGHPQRVGQFLKFPVYDRRGQLIGVGFIEVTR